MITSVTAKVATLLTSGDSPSLGTRVAAVRAVFRHPCEVSFAFSPHRPYGAV